MSDDKSKAPPAAAAEKPVSYGALNSRIGYILRRAQMAVFQDFYRAVAAWNLTPAQYSTLVIIENNPGLSQTQVADALGIKKTNFVAMIKELEARGLACRRSMPGDRRSFALFLTPQGERTMAELEASSNEHEARCEALLGSETYAALFAPLRLLAEFAGEEDRQESAQDD